MKIMVNGTQTETGAETLAAVLDEFGYGDARVATAVNEQFVPVAQRGQTTLEPGDRVEIVTPRQGG